LARPPLISLWTPEHDEKLKALAAQGASAVRAAASLKRSISGVRLRARKLGVELPGVREIRKKMATAMQDGSHRSSYPANVATRSTQPSNVMPDYRA
jgi:hypothetical protein